MIADGYNKSQKGACQLVRNGYTYQRNYSKISGKKIGAGMRVYWKCAMAGCRGTAQTHRTNEDSPNDPIDFGFIPSLVHTHPFEDHKEPKRLFKVWDPMTLAPAQPPSRVTPSAKAAVKKELIKSEIKMEVKINRPEVDLLGGLTQISEPSSNFFGHEVDIKEKEGRGIKIERKRSDDEHERVRREAQYYKEQSKVLSQNINSLLSAVGGLANKVESDAVKTAVCEIQHAYPRPRERSFSFSSTASFSSPSPSLSSSFYPSEVLARSRIAKKRKLVESLQSDGLSTATSYSFSSQSQYSFISAPASVPVQVENDDCSVDTKVLLNDDADLDSLDDLECLYEFYGYGMG